MRVPFLDLKAQYLTIKDEISAGLQDVLDHSTFAGGPKVATFEEDFASYCGTKYAIGVGHGTEALWMALLGNGIGPGDEVITTPGTFIATTEAISFCGAIPVFVDVDEHSCNIDPGQLEAAITDKTKAIVPVHLHGQTADMDPILSIADRHGLVVIEDACQAHGAEYRGRRAGSIGKAGCFSFYPGKNLGAYGEAGAVVTDDGQLAQQMRMFRDHGQNKKYFHAMIGWNCRMDGFQGAVLQVKLRHLEAWTEARRQNAGLYNELLADIPEVFLPKEVEGNRHVYHVYAIRVGRRDALMEHLAAKGIACGIHYPVPIHLQDAYRFLGHRKGDFPRAEKIAETTLSLPMFAELEAEQIKYVCDAIKTFF